MPSDGPSRTAIAVAQYMVSLTERPDTARLLAPGVGEATRRLLEASDNLAPFGLKFFRPAKNYRSMFRGTPKAVRGQLLMVAVRKQFMEEEVRTAIEGGIRQVLVVGAGFDTLCLRLAKEYPDVLFVETDHPATSRVKQRAVEDMGASGPNLQVFAVDLAQGSLADALDGISGWDAGLPSVTVAEGVLPYLRADEVDRFFSVMHERSGPGSRVLVTHRRLNGNGRAGLVGDLGWIASAFLKLLGEKPGSGIPDGSAGRFLKERGYRLDESPQNLRERFLVPYGWGDAPLGEAEQVLAADRIDAGRRGE